MIRNDCLHFRGDIPCKPHKETGVHCDACSHYAPVKKQILIIKLGAIGDVIRTTPLLHRLRKEKPGAEITWITESPDILPAAEIEHILDVSIVSIEWLKARRFDWLINLDKDRLAISLAASIAAEKKSGFTMDDYGRCRPMASPAEAEKWITGLWDDANQANTKHYMQEIFEICGYDFQDEPYILEDGKAGTIGWDIDLESRVIGLNTGCGGRWTSRLWPEDRWTALASRLKAEGHEVVLLGGAQEHEKNRRIAQASGVKYLGHFDLKTFINLVNQCDVVVTAVTMAMHLAIGLKKELVLFNNIFNPHEFHLYGRGVILAPEMDCDCYFTPVCPNHCMETLAVDTVLTETLRLAAKGTPS